MVFMGIFNWLIENVGSVIFWVVFAALLIFFAVAAVRNMNHKYTAGSGMFKNSEGYLDDDKKRDVSDYNYYDDEGKMK